MCVTPKLYPRILLRQVYQCPIFRSRSSSLSDHSGSELVISSSSEASIPARRRIMESRSLTLMVFDIRRLSEGVSVNLRSHRHEGLFG